MLVIVGGSLGCVCRYLLALCYAATGNSNTWVGTLIINIIACLVLGYYLESGYNKQPFGPDLKLLLATGFCGGLSTFSTFAYENYQLIRSGNYSTGLAQVAMSLVFGIGAIALGAWWAKY